MEISVALWALVAQRTLGFSFFNFIPLYFGGNSDLGMLKQVKKSQVKMQIVPKSNQVVSGPCHTCPQSFMKIGR